MSKTLEERITDLEKSRFNVVAHINSLNALTINLWVEKFLEKEEPLKAAFDMKEGMLESARAAPNYKFPGVNPVELDAIAQENERQLEILLDQIIDYLRLRLKAAGRL